MTNLYRVLGVKDFADASEIKTAYRKLSKKFHPDVNDGDKFFEERFKELQHAYETLSDSYQRSIHDDALRREQAGSAGGGHDDRSAQKSQNEARQEQVKKTDPVSREETPEKKKKFSIFDYWALILLIVAGVIIITIARNKEKPTYAVVTPPRPSNSVYRYPEPERNTAPAADIAAFLEDNDNYFSVGSTKDEVLQVQGNPTGISKYEVLGTEVWNYGMSRITFRRGRVSEYSNTGGNLKIRIASPGQSRGARSYFTIGSTKEEVLQAQGDPTGISRYDVLGKEVWDYGFSSVTFESGKVSEFSNASGDLKVHL